MDSSNVVQQDRDNTPVGRAPSIRRALPWEAPVVREVREDGLDLEHGLDLADLPVRASEDLVPVALAQRHLRLRPGVRSAHRRVVVAVASSSTRRPKKVR